MTDSTHAQLHFNEFGMPVATEFDDIYFSNQDGLAESQYVFLQHNDLPRRWQSHPHTTFVIAESGFGTGLNFLATWQELLEHAPSDLKLHYISFEKFPLQPDDLARALSAFPQLQAIADEFIPAYPAAEPGCHRRTFAAGRIQLDLWVGDIHDTLPQWLPHANNSVDAWFLDGFAPDKNPDMWRAPLFEAMAVSGRNAASFATFTAAGAVRRDLQAAGFAIEKVKGYGRKREMLRGHLPQSATPPTTSDPHREVTVVGGGIAAACTAFELQHAGYQVTVISPAIADGASGNPQGAVYPLLHAERSPLAEFFTQAFGYACQFYAQHCAPDWYPCGVVQLGYTPERAERYAKISRAADAQGPGYAPQTVRYLTASATQALWSELPGYPSLYYPQGGWLRPAAIVARLLKDSHVEHQQLASLEPQAQGWQLTFADGSTRHSQTVVLACGAALKQLLEPFAVQLQNVRGQLTQVAATEVTRNCPLVVCYKGYFTPADHGMHCVGATYARDSEDCQTRSTDRDENMANLRDNLAPTSWPHELKPMTDRAAVRNTTRDHLPMVGELAANLWVIGGLGSRGFTAAPLAASTLVAALQGQPLPMPASLWQRLQPQRLQKR
ncbi:bifunctional tRNA (5-methylaminomethyl-2-thiouridine)(34)-methyltransferase MnmD/FAD-dependent 5-carboxymethylaminomethyl-2-thiouridine(34) oxidoreductase MnmC [Pseudidiomarina homiensis]|uniref:bifunctional tRNA (5-methylaminomethyl-2-thiouridine)(34)-methyltransferase MnmD/FAD-dependent 5-carboxymethylaminomethyl-2-thiouridine(34) oxidoreductase MnmC n=1 Tax=Pseudidiomarina homiensis TaxID=364198 RepID=UPI00215AB366|nr:bifunctional tRNA (5-methylaminomethyl-2-thiouridine)(34)-methyltransferase MnmD/FAD-dependent 5-carboxymethylaminomethyl-2-thiouridine(34) oxidoreductase MnmC [Pseudidiomarina homiensis]